MGLNMRRRPFGHVIGLLSQYRNGQLSAHDMLYVRRHLQACPACREEFALGVALSRKASADMALLVSPPLSLLDQVWAKLDAPIGSAPRSSQVGRVKLWVAWLGALLWAQARLLPKGLWVASAMAVTFTILMGLAWRGGTYPPFILGLVITPIAAAGGALLYGPEHDPGLEVALATTTPPQVVLMSRFLLALGYDCIAALVASIVLTLARGESLSSLVTSWFGPTLLITGLSVFVSVRGGSTLAYSFVAVLWCARLLSLIVEPNAGLGGHVLTALSALWQTTPLVIAAALLLYAAAMLTIPREVHAM